MQRKNNRFITGKLIFGERKILLESGDESYFVRPFSLRGKGIHGERIRAKIVLGKQGTRLAEVEYQETIAYSEELLLGRFIMRKGRSYFRLLESFGLYETLMPLPPKPYTEGDIFTCRFQRNGKITLLQKFANNEDFDIDERILLFTASVKTEFPPSLDGELAHLDKNPLSPNQLTRRTDFRSLYTLTIDGADAKDLDDAFSLSKNPHGDFVLTVHIADVAEYVREGTLLDHEALARATSIYTPGKVIPMLPEVLSNELCSLHPGAPKLTLSVEMTLDSTGHVKSTNIVEGIIESRKRGVYDEIFRFFENLPQHASTHEDGETQTIRLAFELYNILSRRRKKEGKILFESTESTFSFSSPGIPTHVEARTRNAAHMLIEEFMVLTNEEVAKWCHTHGLPFLSRVHGEPGATGQEALEYILKKRKNHLLTPKDIRDFMDTLRDESEIYRYSRLLLPKMAKANYSDKHMGHFGLALDFYAHFTSPIRRYPDLQVHRIIKEKLNGLMSRERVAHYKALLPKVAKRSSERERRAEDLERAFDALYACRYMRSHVGETFSGRVSGLSEFALFVELENSIEVTVYLPRGKKYTPGNLDGHLYDARGKIIATLGDFVSVRISEVLQSERRIVAEVVVS